MLRFALFVRFQYSLLWEKKCPKHTTMNFFFVWLKYFPLFLGLQSFYLMEKDVFMFFFFFMGFMFRFKYILFSYV